MSDEKRCPSVAGLVSTVRCELAEGHNSPHQNTGSGGVMTWEPRYVADLRSDAETTQEALAGLAEAARRFSTEAAYEVEEPVEEEFIDALEYAERLIASDAPSEQQQRRTS